MTDEKVDIVVIGAGPAGLIAAREAAKRGTNVAVLEEHGEIGSPCHCAGLLSIKGLAEIGVPLNDNFIQNKIRGAYFYSPSKLSFMIERKEYVACLVDRTAFDKFLAQQALREGAKVRLGSEVRFVKRVNGKIVVGGRWGSITADVVVDAEGVASRNLREIGLQFLSRGCILPALQYDLVGVDVDPRHVEVHLSNKTAPGFFAWIIPINENSARVGLACREANPYERLEAFIKGRFGENRSRISTRSGLIATCGPLKKTFSGNLIVVGDAAGQSKPITGGGVILGGLCAMIAGEVAAEAVKRRDFTSNYLRRYEILWRRRLGREFKLTLLARKITNRLSDKTIDEIFKAIIESNLQSELSMKGDMDLQGKTILRILKKRSLLKVLSLAIKGSLLDSTG